MVSCDLSPSIIMVAGQRIWHGETAIIWRSTSELREGKFTKVVVDSLIPDLWPFLSLSSPTYPRAGHLRKQQTSLRPVVTFTSANFLISYLHPRNCFPSFSFAFLLFFFFFQVLAILHPTPSSLPENAFFNFFAIWAPLLNSFYKWRNSKVGLPGGGKGEN